MQGLKKQSPEYCDGWYAVVSRSSNRGRYWTSVKEHSDTQHHSANKEVQEFRTTENTAVSDKELAAEFRSGQVMALRHNAFSMGAFAGGFRGTVTRTEGDTGMTK